MGKQNLFQAVTHAVEGLLYCICHERNMKIHVIAAILAGGLAWRLELNPYEMLILLLTVASVIVAEMINTVVETVVDMISPESHPAAKIAKDVAAGAVLVTAITSLIVGYILFFNKIWG